jgi:hypothetical protein
MDKLKKIKFYKNVNSMEEERIRELINMSPLERIKNTVELIRRIYPIRTKIKGKKKINFQ